MTMDRSLKVQAGAIKSRNVLTRAERVVRLKELDRWQEGMDVVGMPNCHWIPSDACSAATFDP